jgi:hypothetical protein
MSPQGPVAWLASAVRSVIHALHSATLCVSPQGHQDDRRGAAGTPQEEALVMTTPMISENIALAARSEVERMTGIEPALSAWEADVLPLNYIRRLRRSLAQGERLRCPRPHGTGTAGLLARRSPMLASRTNRSPRSHRNMLGARPQAPGQRMRTGCRQRKSNVPILASARKACQVWVE